MYTACMDVASLTPVGVDGFKSYPVFKGPVFGEYEHPSSKRLGPSNCIKKKIAPTTYIKFQ
jgi:hypothetical protein